MTRSVLKVLVLALAWSAAAGCDRGGEGVLPEISVRDSWLVHLILDARGLIGRELVQNRHYEEAVPHLEAVASLRGFTGDLPLWLGVALLHTERAAEGEAMLTEVAATSGSPWVLNYAGWHAVTTKHYELAVALLSRCVELDPEQVNAFNNLGWALLELGRLEEAEVALRRQIEIVPDHRWAFNNLGRTLMRQGRLVEAEAHFAWQIRLEPTDAASHCNLALSRARAGNVEGALAAYWRHVTLRPNDPCAAYRLAAHLPPLQGLAIVREARQRHPESRCLRAREGWLLARAGRCEAAVSLLEAVRREDPDSELASSGLERCEAASGVHRDS